MTQIRDHDSYMERLADELYSQPRLFRTVSPASFLEKDGVNLAILIQSIRESNGSDYSEFGPHIDDNTGRVFFIVRCKKLPVEEWGLKWIEI